MEKLLAKDRLNDWVAACAATWEAHAPEQIDGVWTYRPVAGAVALDHPNTTQPPKNFAFPQREVFFRFEQAKGQPPKISPILPEAKPSVVFGVRPCDAKGALHMDRVFAEPMADVYYQTRRGNMATVGLACNRPPSPQCFCQSVGGSPVSGEGMDILLTDLGERYFVAALTERGEDLMAAGAALFADPGKADRADLKKTHADALARPQKRIDNPAAVTAGLKARHDSPVWEEMAQPCIGCGICTFLCPTCHCFDINDEVTGSTPLKGHRVRTWDNCQFPDFTMHTSGHNPRASLGARLRQRVGHKFQYFPENYGVFQCTGCGRCTSDCPVGIDIVAVVNKVVADVR